MKKLLLAILAILAIPAFAFAATIAPTTATWDATTGGDLAFNVTGATNIISYENAVNIGTAPLYFTFSSGYGTFGKEDYKYDSGTLTIYESAMKKMPNTTFALVVTTTDTAIKTVTVADSDLTVDLTSEGFSGVGSVVLKKDSATITFAPSEFSFSGGTLTIAKGVLANVTKGDYTATIYKGLPVTLTVSGNSESDIKSNTNIVSSSSKSTDTSSSANNGSSSGGGGCNAGFGVFALLALMPLAFKRK